MKERANTASRTLLLLRHGKSAYPGGVTDHDRPLAERGRRESALAGDWVRAEVPPVDAVVCSTALRARQTLDATGLTAPTTYVEEIFEATPNAVLEVIRATDDAVRTLLVVGHGPGLPGLTSDLAGDGSDRDALREVRSHFPTSTVAVLRFVGAWDALGYAGADVTDLHVARA